MPQAGEKGPLVSVVIVNWNGKYLLEECLGSLARQRFRDFQVIVVDNGSRDGSLEYVREAHPEVMLIPLEVNTGFAFGSNAGIRAASGKYIALLNNDTRADPAWLEELVAAAESTPSAGMWASKILSYDRPDIIDNVGLLLYRDGLARGKGRLEQDRGQYDERTEALFPSGCAGLYRRRLFDETGLLDEAFFAYADDVDLGLRGRLAGWDCLFIPTAIVYHRYSSSSSSYSPLKAFLVERNRIWVLLKYFPVELILISPIFTIKRLLLQFAGALSGQGASGKFTREQSVFAAVLILFKAWGSAFAGVPRILRQRRQVRSFKRIGRKELYGLFNRYAITAAEIAFKD